MAKKLGKTRKPRRDPDEVDPILYLDENEVDQLHKAAGKLGRNKDRDQAMILLAYHHGLRASELCKLRWDRVYLDKEEMYITRCKGSRSGMHWLFPEDVKALKRLGPERAGYVFKSEAKKNPGSVSPTGFFLIVQRAGKAALLGNKVHPHQLRHACGFFMHRQGFDEREIMEWLGHRDIRNTAIYTALETNHMKEKWKRVLG